MQKISAREAKNRFGHVLETSQHEEIVIERHGRPYSVVMSIRHYNKIHSDNAQSLQKSSSRLLDYLGVSSKSGDKTAPEDRIRMLRDEWE